MNDGDLFDRLGQDARRRRESRMVPPNGTLSYQTRRGIIGDIKRFMKREGIELKHVAKTLGVRADALQAALDVQGHDDTHDGLLVRANNWIEDESMARRAERPAEFVWTRVARKMQAVVDQLRRRADIMICTGPAGIGKSLTIEALKAEYGGGITAVSVRGDQRSATALKKAIWQASSSRRSTSSVTVDMLIERLVQPPSVKARRVLIIDQAHLLRASALQVLMDLHDHARLSILLVGTIDVRTMTSDDEDPHYSQFSSRVGMRIDLAPEVHQSTGGKGGGKKLYTVTEIKQVFATGRVKLHNDAAKMLRVAATLPGKGHLRRAARIYDTATSIAEYRGLDEITVDLVQEALDFLDQGDSFSIAWADEGTTATAKEASA